MQKHWEEENGILTISKVWLEAATEYHLYANPWRRLWKNASESEQSPRTFLRTYFSVRALFLLFFSQANIQDGKLRD